MAEATESNLNLKEEKGKKEILYAAAYPSFLLHKIVLL